MFVKSGLMIVSLAAAFAAFAQPNGQLSASDCEVEEAALERDIDLARSKGQMLRRRELAEALSSLKARCQTLAPAQSRAVRIEKLEQEIRELRLELERAEELLRKLKAEGP
jgi:predicted RNase H-like nuclease (RuvC/YqgF family)